MPTAGVSNAPLELPRPSGRCAPGIAFGSIAAFVLLWFATIAVIIPGFLLPDLQSVFMQDGCIGGGPVTVFVLCIMEVIAASLLLGKFAVPAFFTRAVWSKYDNLKKRKIIGMIAQIVVRFSCAIQLIVVVLPEFSIKSGLFSDFNAKVAYSIMQQDGKVTTCAHDPQTRQAAYAFRTWTFCKYHMIAVHAWELAYIPDLTTDSWLHHLFVIFVGSLGSDPQSLTGKPEIQPFIDSIGFSFILGASLNCLVKACVIMYHKTAPVADRQACWMWMSISGALVLTVATYCALPCIVVFVHWNEIGTATSCEMLVLTAFLVAVEVRLLLVKRIIAINATLKARRQVSVDAPKLAGEASPETGFIDAPISFSSTRQLSMPLGRQLSEALASPTLQYRWQEQEPEALSFYETFG